MSEQMQEPVQEKSEKKERVSRRGTTIIKIGALTIVEKGGQRFKVLCREHGINFSLARVPSGAWVASGQSSTGSYRRLTINATDVGDAAAEAVERLHGLVDPARAATLKLVTKPNHSIAQAMVEGLKHLGSSDERRQRLRTNAGYFVDWCDKRRLSRWEEITPDTIDSYMKEVARRLKSNKDKVSKYTLKHYHEPIRVVSERMALQHQAHYINVVALAKSSASLATELRSVESKSLKAALSIAEVMEFVTPLLQGDEYEQQIGLGVLFQAFDGTRVKEIFYLPWSKVNLEAGTFDIEDEVGHQVKNVWSVRRLPLPKLLWDALKSMPKGSGRILSLVKSWKGYGKAVGKRLRAWKPDTTAKPKDLRRTVPTHARKNRVAEKWNDYYLEKWLGHAARTVTDGHYVGDEEASYFAEELRREVADKIDAAIDRWRASKTAVSAESCSHDEARPAQHIAQVVEIRKVG